MSKEVDGHEAKLQRLLETLNSGSKLTEGDWQVILDVGSATERTAGSQRLLFELFERLLQPSQGSIPFEHFRNCCLAIQYACRSHPTAIELDIKPLLGSLLVLASSNQGCAPLISRTFAHLARAGMLRPAHVFFIFQVLDVTFKIEWLYASLLPLCQMIRAVTERTSDSRDALNLCRASAELVAALPAKDAVLCTLSAWATLAAQRPSLRRDLLQCLCAPIRELLSEGGPEVCEIGCVLLRNLLINQVPNASIDKVVNVPFEVLLKHPSYPSTVRWAWILFAKSCKFLPPEWQASCLAGIDWPQVFESLFQESSTDEQVLKATCILTAGSDHGCPGYLLPILSPLRRSNVLLFLIRHLQAFPVSVCRSLRSLLTWNFVGTTQDLAPIYDALAQAIASHKPGTEEGGACWGALAAMKFAAKGIAYPDRLFPFVTPAVSRDWHRFLSNVSLVDPMAVRPVGKSFGHQSYFQRFLTTWMAWDDPQPTWTFLIESVSILQNDIGILDHAWRAMTALTRRSPPLTREQTELSLDAATHNTDCATLRSVALCALRSLGLNRDNCLRMFALTLALESRQRFEHDVLIQEEVQRWMGPFNELNARGSSPEEVEQRCLSMVREIFAAQLGQRSLKPLAVVLERLSSRRAIARKVFGDPSVRRHAESLAIEHWQSKVASCLSSVLPSFPKDFDRWHCGCYECEQGGGITVRYADYE